jgi:hypothetical protein
LLTLILPAALLIELIAGSPRLPTWIAWLLRVCLAAAIPRILLHGSVYLSADGEWSPGPARMVLAVCAVLLAGSWGLLSWLSQRSSAAVSIPLALFLSTLCAGLTVMMAGYIKGGAAAWPLGGALLATTIAAWLASQCTGERGNFGLPAMIGVGVVGLFGLLFIGRYFGALSTERALVILLAPLLCWITECPPLVRWNAWLKGILRLGLVAIPLVVVLVQAKRDFDRDMAPLLVNHQFEPPGEISGGVTIAMTARFDALR